MHLDLYGCDLPAFLHDAIETPVFRRLRHVGMNCGCEYTRFPLFRDLAPYSRYDHSIGVAMIVWQHTHDPAQAMAGLLHDIATPVFAHVVDFMRGDYRNQESTEEGTEAFIRTSPELMAVLKRSSLRVDAVKDYHLYPIADNDTPKLSADRLEYTIGNMIGYGFATRDEAAALYHDVVVDVNEHNEPELMFAHEEQAIRFAEIALRCSDVYVADADRYSMQILSELLREAVDRGVITMADLHTTEPEVIAKLTSDGVIRGHWQWFTQLCATRTGAVPQPGEPWRRIHAKKRYIDPYVKDHGRVSALNASIKARITSFCERSQDDWICGITETE